MKICTYDFEVLAHDWLLVVKDKESGTFTKIWNDNEAVKACINDDTVYFGFNSKHYDQYIMMAICCDFTPEEVKKVNDYIIGGGQGWEYPDLKDYFFKFNNADIMDDMQAGLSLKSIEGHLGMNITESSVSFDIPRPLTEQERKEMEYYCCCDVDATEWLLTIRKDYLKNKLAIGRMCGIRESKALSMTNAKLTALLLMANKQPHKDERDYVLPATLDLQYVPKEALEFFSRMHDMSLSDEEVFASKLEIQIGECPVTLAYGGIHGAIPNYRWEEGE